MGYFDEAFQKVGASVREASGQLDPTLNPILGPIADKAGIGSNDIQNKIWGGQTSNQPPPPGMDPRIAQVKQGQNDLYNQFSANKGNTEKSLLRQYQLQAHRDLADKQAQIRRDAHQRGFMSSYGGEEKAAADSASSVASAKQNINSATDSLQQQLQQEAMDSGFLQQRMVSDLNDTIYNQAIKNMVDKNKSMISGFQSAGAIGGTAAANSKR